MKKNRIIWGVVYIMLGFISLYTAIRFTNHKMAGFFYGLAGALGANGLLTIIRCFYWNRNKVKYQEKLEKKEIDKKDELKESLRNKAGRHTYWIGVMIITISILVYSVLGIMDIMDTNHIVVFLGLYLISQVVIGIVIYNYLLKQYR